MFVAEIPQQTQSGETLPTQVSVHFLASVRASRAFDDFKPFRLVRTRIEGWEYLLVYQLYIMSVPMGINPSLDQGIFPKFQSKSFNEHNIATILRLQF